jgi:hypothetical protein
MATPPPWGPRPVCTCLPHPKFSPHSFHIPSPMNMEWTQCPETSAINTIRRRTTQKITHDSPLHDTRWYPKYSGQVLPSIQQLWYQEAPVPTGQTANSGFYYDVLWWLRENVQRHHPELWQEQTWLLHHDNAPSQTSIPTQKFLTKHKMAVIPHHTPLIWHPVTSSYFQKLNWSWKDAGLLPLRRSRPNHSESLTHWQKRSSRKHSKNEGDGGTGVYMWEGTASRVMVGPVCTCGRELLRGWWWDRCVHVGGNCFEGDGGTGVHMWEGTASRVVAADRPYGEFYYFTASVRNILDTTTCIKYHAWDIKEQVDKMMALRLPDVKRYGKCYLLLEHQLVM